MILITDELLSKAAYEVDMAILDMLPEPSECDHVFSASFENKIKKLIRKAKHFVAYKVLKRVACILIAIILSGCLFVALHPSARAAVVDWVKEKVDDFYHYFFIGETKPETVIPDTTENTKDTDGIDATEATSVAGEMKKYYLSWVPEGYALLTSFDEENKITYIYVDATGQMMQFNYMHGDDNRSLLIGGGDYEQKYVTVGSMQAEVLLAKTSEHSNAVIWKSEDGNIIFAISAFVDEDDLIKMVENCIVEE